MKLSDQLAAITAYVETGLAEELRGAVVALFTRYYNGAPPPGWHGRKLVDSGKLKSDTTTGVGVTVKPLGAGNYELTISTPYARFLIRPGTNRPALTLVEGEDLSEVLRDLLIDAISSRRYD